MLSEGARGTGLRISGAIVPSRGTYLYVLEECLRTLSHAFWRFAGWQGHQQVQWSSLGSRASHPASKQTNKQSKQARSQGGTPRRTRVTSATNARRSSLWVPQQPCKPTLRRLRSCWQAAIELSGPCSDAFLLHGLKDWKTFELRGTN